MVGCLNRRATRQGARHAIDWRRDRNVKRREGTQDRRALGLGGGSAQLEPPGEGRKLLFEHRRREQRRWLRQEFRGFWNPLALEPAAREN